MASHPGGSSQKSCHAARLLLLLLLKTNVIWQKQYTVKCTENMQYSKIIKYNQYSIIIESYLIKYSGDGDIFVVVWNHFSSRYRYR